MAQAKQESFEDYANEIIPGLWLGSEDAAHMKLSVLQKHKIRAILIAGFGIQCIHGDSKEIEYKKLKCIDLPIYESQVQHFTQIEKQFSKKEQKK